MTKAMGRFDPHAGWTLVVGVLGSLLVVIAVVCCGGVL